MNIAEQLTDIYLTEETWHVSKLSKEESDLYHDTLLSKGNIIVIRDGEQVVGYCEFWLVNDYQLDAILGNQFNQLNEDLSSGYICYIANLFVLKGYRNSATISMIKKRLFEVTKKCVLFIGERNKNGKRYIESKKKRLQLLSV